jgi:hypothetical protein
MLIVSSVLATVLVLGIALGSLLIPMPHLGWAITFGLRWPLLAIVPGAALFIVRGYAITSEAVFVVRPFWRTRLSRRGLQSATFEPGAMSGSLRLCGNGGFFSFTGLFSNKRLGRYRAFVTDPKLTVVLRYEGRTVVLSPERPEEFVRELQEIW